MALLLLLGFTSVTLVTTTLSLTRYCLTRDAADARALPWGREAGR